MDARYFPDPTDENGRPYSDYTEDELDAVMYPRVTKEEFADTEWEADKRSSLSISDYYEICGPFEGEHEIAWHVEHPNLEY